MTHAAWHGQKSWNGVAILSREPLEVRQVGLPGEEELGARLLSAQVGDLAFTTVYCPNGKSVAHDDYRTKLTWFDSLAAWFDEHHEPSERAVLCGDFNIVREPLDSWNEDKLGGGIFHTEAERARMQRLLDLGLYDAWREKRPDDPGFSWWDYRRGAFHKHQGLRIDLLLVTEPLLEQVQSAELERGWRKKVDGLTASDHAPVWIDLG